MNACHVRVLVPSVKISTALSASAGQ